MSVTTEKKPLNNVQRFLASENLLAGLITVMTIFTAVVAYQVNLANGDSLKNFFIAQATLNDATLYFIEQGQELFYDHNVYDQYQIALLEQNNARATHYAGQLSTLGQEALARNPNEYPFDTLYEEAIYSQAWESVAEATEVYQLAVDFNLKGDNLGLVATILAVGLAFAAWGSLAKEASRQRMFFAGLSMVALLIATIEYLRITTTF